MEQQDLLAGTMQNLAAAAGKLTALFSEQISRDGATEAVMVEFATCMNTIYCVASCYSRMHRILERAESGASKG